MIRMWLGVLAWMFFCVSAEGIAADSAPDTETLANRTFESSCLKLIRGSLPSLPKADVQIQGRSPWHIDYFAKGSTRWWQVVFFGFNGYSPAVKQELGGVAVTVFIYDPANNHGSIMTPEDAVLAIRKGRELNSVPPPSPTPTPVPRSESNGELI
jgi:hypothetical protein